MSCNKCNSKVNCNDTYCPNCGAKIEKEKIKKSKKNNTKLIIIVLIIIVLWFSALFFVGKIIVDKVKDYIQEQIEAYDNSLDGTWSSNDTSEMYIFDVENQKFIYYSDRNNQSNKCEGTFIISRGATTKTASSYEYVLADEEGLYYDITTENITCSTDGLIEEENGKNIVLQIKKEAKTMNLYKNYPQNESTLTKE